MSTPKTTSTVCSVPTIEDELAHGIEPEGYHSTIARIGAGQAADFMTAGATAQAHERLVLAHDAESNFHRVYPERTER